MDKSEPGAARDDDDGAHAPMVPATTAAWIYAAAFGAVLVNWYIFFGESTLDPAHAFGFLVFNTLVSTHLLSCVVVVGSNTVVCTDVFGKYNRTLYPGMNLLCPLLERVHYYEWSRIVDNPDGSMEKQAIRKYEISTQEDLFDMPAVSVVTSDGLKAEADFVAYIMINNPVRAVYGTKNMWESFCNLFNTTCKGVVSQFTLAGARSSGVKICTDIRNGFADRARRLGVELTDLDVQSISADEDVEQSIEDMVVARNEADAIRIRAAAQREAAEGMASVQGVAYMRMKESGMSTEEIAEFNRAQATRELARSSNKMIISGGDPSGGLVSALAARGYAAEPRRSSRLAARGDEQEEASEWQTVQPGTKQKRK